MKFVNSRKLINKPVNPKGNKLSEFDIDKKKKLEENRKKMMEDNERISKLAKEKREEKKVILAKKLNDLLLIPNYLNLRKGIINLFVDSLKRDLKSMEEGKKNWLSCEVVPNSQILFR
jgi:hypothetical protein